MDVYRAALVVVARSDQTNGIRLDGNLLTTWQNIDNTAYSVAREPVRLLELIIVKVPSTRQKEKPTNESDQG